MAKKNNKKRVETYSRKRIRGRVRRNYKDSIFRLLFSDKENALELYNALSGAALCDPGQLEVTTIDNVIYMGVKNDLSFLVGGQMYLVEEQSTWSPNMPLRGLIYFSGLYQGYVEKRELDVYSHAKLSLPQPVYIVFYIGEEERPENEILYLSDSFDQLQGQERSAVEVIVHVININYGKNQKLMAQCKQLQEYSFLIDLIRRYSRITHTLEQAVDLAVEDCIEQGILKEFLLKHRGEVNNVILTRYNEGLHIRSEKALSFSEGIRQGMQQGMQQGTRNGLFHALDNYLARNPGLEVSDAASLLGFTEQETNLYLESRRNHAVVD